MRSMHASPEGMGLTQPGGWTRCSEEGLSMLLAPTPPFACPSDPACALMQDVAVNVVGKYRYRMTSPADSTWVPLIIDIILVRETGREATRAI